ncbi:probable aspartyl protease At4g16563 [Prunus dulcis]|uniref:probable aspartyl protease At4g16563 n=1 Tax=Prunus dulcis TaxID=3755 RepID=UPI00148323D2|nr:probable aspartyl protease At4g16563 [Prunus dulcis]
MEATPPSPKLWHTPPQTLPFIMDTGSDLTWFPCGKNYQCINCSIYLNNTAKVKSFIPILSSSSKTLACLNPKCARIYPKIHCPDCKLGSKNCTWRYPWYTYPYGSGNPSGSLPSEMQHLRNCRWHYRLSGPLGGKDSIKKTKGVSYTPFVKNPEAPGRGHFLTSYYVGLRRITVGGRSVKISYRYLRPDKNSSGGTIVDSRTTFTYMAPEVFERMAGEFEKFTKGYKREEEVEALTRLRPCYNVSRIETPTFPSVTFHFNGGLRWRCRRRITWCQPVGRWCA